MNSRGLVDALQIPVALTILLWLIIFLMMVGIEAIWYIDRQI